MIQITTNKKKDLPRFTNEEIDKMRKIVDDSPHKENINNQTAKQRYDKKYSGDNLKNAPLPNETFKVKRSYKLYIFAIVTPILAIIIFIALFLAKTSLVWLIIYGITAIPLFLLSSLVFWIKVYIDRKKIGGVITKKVTNNYIKAIIFKHGKLLDITIRPILSDGTFNYAGGNYTIDEAELRKDNFGDSVGFYLHNLPNPLKFNFSKDFNTFMNAINKGKPNDAKDDHGDVIDISYSAITLKKLKQDKIFEEFHRSDGGIDKIILYVVGGMCFVIIMILIFRG